MTGCATGGSLRLYKIPEGLLQLVFRVYKKPPMSILRVESDFQTTKKAHLPIFLERETFTEGGRK